MLTRMDSYRSMTPARHDGPHPGTFRRRALETSYWMLAAVFLAAYCGAQIYGDREQRRAFSMSFTSRAPVRVESDVVLEPRCCTPSDAPAPVEIDAAL